MSIEQALPNLSYLQVEDQETKEMLCGSNQEWYPTERQRLTGCGPSVAANILFYHQKKYDSHCCSQDKANLLRMMEEAWKYVTPESDGIPSSAMFCEKLRHYADIQHEEYHFSVLDVPSEIDKRPSLQDVIDFLLEGLQRDIPIAFLNLDNGDETTLESWHWVTITSLSATDDSAAVQICDEAIIKHINLRLWLETTIQGGSFVYFYPVAAAKV